MNKLILISGILITFLFTSCASINVSSDYDRQANFSNYKSYAFHQKGLEKLKMNDLDKRRVVAAVKQTLQAKGFTETSYETAADLIVNINATHKKRVDINAMNNMWGWGWGPGWGWGMGWGPDYNIREYKEGTIIIDLVDRKNNTLVWQGAGEGLNVSDLDRKAEKIPEAVEKILENFPPSE